MKFCFLFLSIYLEHLLTYSTHPHSSHTHLTVESPAGVGFSYSDDPTKDYIIDDNQTALDNYHFLVNFFNKYSEFSKLDFFVA